MAVGRDHHGTWLSETEAIYNAMQRRLSCYTDAELMNLRKSARELINLIDEIYQERAIPDGTEVK